MRQKIALKGRVSVGRFLVATLPSVPKLTFESVPRNRWAPNDLVDLVDLIDSFDFVDIFDLIDDLIDLIYLIDIVNLIDSVILIAYV